MTINGLIVIPSSKFLSTYIYIFVFSWTSEKENENFTQSYHFISAAEDVEAGIRKPKFQAEPTLPIYLKVKRKKKKMSCQVAP